MAFARPRWFQNIARFAALLALALQVFDVGTHIDLRANGQQPIAVIAQSYGSVVHADVAAPAKAHAVCLVCQVVATSGRTLLAGAVTSAPPAFTTITATPDAQASSAQIAAHSWQSRAPPIAL